MPLKVLSKDGFYGWINMAVMFFFNIVVMLMIAAFSIFLPYWVKEFDWSRGVISGAQTVSIIISGLAAPMVAIFIMKQGAKRAVVIGNLANVLGLVMLAYQNYIWQLYLANGVIIGLGMSVGGMLAMMTVINNWFVVKRSAALSISMAAMGFSGVVANPALMALIKLVGWRNTYLMMAAAAFLFCVVVPALLLKNRPEDLGQVPDGAVSTSAGKMDPVDSPNKKLYRTQVDFTAMEAFRTRALWLLVAYGTLQFLVMGGFMTHQVAYLFDIGISPTMAAIALGTLSAAMGISQLGIGFLGLRFNMHSLAIISVLIGIVGFAIVLFANSLPLIIAYSVIYGVSQGILSIAMGNLFPDYFGRTEFPKIMGYTMPLNTIISSFGAPITGFIRDATGSYILAFKILLALLMVSFFCIIFAKPPLHPSLRESHP